MPPKRHHYVPQFFLSRFCRDGMIWVYDRDLNTFRRQQPINTAVIKDYYTAVAEDGEKNVETEELLSRIETATKPVLDKVDAGESLTDEDRQCLAVFIGFLATRVPDFEKTVGEFFDQVGKTIVSQVFATPERTRAVMERMDQDYPGTPPTDAEQLSDFVKSREYTIKPHRNVSIAVMLQVAVQQAALFNQMNWLFIRAPAKTSFVLSDNPLSILPPKRSSQPEWMGVGIITPGATKMLPLGQRACLLMGDHGDDVGYKDATQDLVREANLATTVRADRYAFARDERQLKSLVSPTGIAHWKRGPRISFG